MAQLLSTIQQQCQYDLQLQLGHDAIWDIYVECGAEGIFKCNIRWSDYQLLEVHCLVAQRLLLAWWTPFIINGQHAIKSHNYRQADTLLRLLTIYTNHHSSKALSELEPEEWQHITILMLFHVWKDNPVGTKRLSSVTKPLSKQMLERTLTVLKQWFQSYQIGDVNDGPDYLISTKAIEKTLKQHLKKIKIDYNDWKSGGSFGSVPFVIAHLLLADALNTLHSEKTQQLLAYFETIREQNAHSLVQFFWSSFGIKSQLYKYRNSGQISQLTQRVEASPNTNLAKRKIAKPLHEKLLQIHKKYSPNSTFTFPWKNHLLLLRDYNNLQSAIYIIFLSVMGKRGPSEVRTLRGVDIIQADAQSGRDTTMFPSIEKTNQGLRQAQGVTNFIDESFEVLLKLGYHDKTGTDLPLFSALSRSCTIDQLPTRLSTDRAHKRLQDYYSTFCERTEPKVDFDLHGMHSNLCSHQFRHSFAEFALRKFDGNVEELIRQHFCHSYNHWWTKRYTADKLDEQQKNSINRAYIRELVPRIIYDNADKPDFVGAVALFIKKEISDKIAILTPEQTEKHIESICKDIIQVSAHEYGFCLLLKRFKSMAKCQDINGTPNPSSSSFDKCISCSNFCASRISHLSKHEKIVISHIDFLEQGVWRLPSMKERSRKAVKDAQKAFPELKKYGEA